MLQVAVLVGFCMAAISATCPHEESGLTLFSSVANIDKSSDVVITTGVLLDVALVDVNTITISGDGRLVFDQGSAITVRTKSIMVEDNGALIIGSKDCRHSDDVNIYLEGERSANRDDLTSAGEKYIAVKDDGTLRIFGPEKLAWTKLTFTVDRYVDDKDNVQYSHLTERIGWWRWNEGLTLYRFCCSDEVDKASYVSYQVYDTVAGDSAKEQKSVDKMTTALDAITDGEIVGISIQYHILNKEETDFGSLYDKIEDVAGIPRDQLLLRDAPKWSAFSLVFVKGSDGDYSQSLDVPMAGLLTMATASLDIGGRKITAMSKVYRGKKYLGNIDFRITTPAAGYPTVTVLDDVRGSWSVGDEVLLTSTDYAVTHAEIRRIKEFVSDNSFKLDGELEYRHFGEIEDRVDMRGEVALLSRNIRIEGVMGPCGDAEDCKLDYSTHGGHIKAIESFNSVIIEGAALRYMGQAFDKGNYPIHFHMCLNITGKSAIVRQNVIRDSFARAVTVHGTFGTSETEPGVLLFENVAHNIFGHAFFLEDGAEVATMIYGNLASRVKNIDNGFVTDKGRATAFWITNPKVLIVNNVATGCDGFGFWYTFPRQPVGPSAGLNIFDKLEARHTPLWTFDNNVGHSNTKGGMNFDNILSDDNGKVEGCMNYAAVSDPKKPKASTTYPVKVQLTRFTAYKNRDWNVWVRGGYFEIIQFSSAESKRGLQCARASKQPQYVRKSVFLGQSTKNAEEEGYPDAYTPKIMGRYNGFVVYDGPVYISETYFNKFSFEVNDTYYSSAIGFHPKSKFFSSVHTSFSDIRFGYDDNGASSKRVFDGHILHDEVLGFGDFDGDESATMRDLDGSVSRCTGDTRQSQLVKPEKFSLTDNCVLRENWKMAICDEKYGKVKISNSLFSETPAASFDPYGVMRRRRYSDAADVAFEDHIGSHRTNFMTVLGDKDYYYEFQYPGNVFPQKITIFGTGIERDLPLVMGMCLPEGITKEDLTIRWSSPDDVVFVTESIRWVDTLASVSATSPGSNPRMMLKDRILYWKLTSRRTRNNAWDAYDYQNCPGSFCPYVNIAVSRNLPSSPCFDTPASEIDSEYSIDGLDRMTCNLPASAPEADWGAGDTATKSRDGNWGVWGQWSECCNEEGSTSKSYRYRMCDNPPKYGDGLDCPGVDTEEKACTQDCSVDAEWSNWSTWSDCFCDGLAAGTKGAITRSRECIGGNHLGTFCNGGKYDYRACNGDCGQYANP